MRPVAEPKPARPPAPPSSAPTSPPMHAATAPPPGSFRHRAHAIGHAVSRQPHLQAIRDGVLGALPIILLGSGFLLLWQPPWPGLSRFLPPQSTLGAGGLFPAFAAAIFAVEVIHFFAQRRWGIRLSGGAPDVVVRSFAAMLPATVCVVVVWLLVHVLGVEHVHE